MADDTRRDSKPWRVEGARPDARNGQGQPPGPRLFGPRFWVWLLALLLLNWVLSALLVRPRSAPRSPTPSSGPRSRRATSPR